MPTWLDDTRRQLSDAPRWLSLSQIAQDTGLQVSWLSAFAADKMKDPGITKVQALHDYLAIVPCDLRPERVKFGEAPTSDFRAGVYIVWGDKDCLYVDHSDDMASALVANTANNLFSGYEPTHVDLIYTGDGTDNVRRRYALTQTKTKALSPVLNRRDT